MSDAREKWVRLCLLREAAVNLCRDFFRQTWGQRLSVNPSGHPWEGTIDDCERLCGVLTDKKAYEPHEMAFIRSGEVDSWELQILSKVLAGIGVPTEQNIASVFSTIFAGILKTDVAGERTFNVCSYATNRIFEASGVPIDPLIQTCPVAEAEKHLKVMGLLRKGNLLRIFKKDVTKAIKTYGEAVEFATSGKDAKLVVAVVLLTAIQVSEVDLDWVLAEGELFLTLALRRVETQPDSWECHADLGKMYKLLDKKDLALEAFSEALKLNPTRADLMDIVDELRRKSRPKESTALGDSLKFMKGEVGLNISEKMVENVAGFLRKNEDPLMVAHSYAMEGCCYEEGLSGKLKDMKKAAELYGKASKLGDPKAKVELARLYRHGLHFRKNLKKSAELLEEAIKAPKLTKEFCEVLGKTEGEFHPGVGEAFLALGEYHQQGIWYPSCPQLALYHYNKALELGNLAAAYNIGFYHARGMIVERDEDKAAQFWRMAADAGHGLAMLQLAFWSLETFGDVSMAQSWFRRANDRGCICPQTEASFKEKLEEIKEKLKFIKTQEKKLGLVPDANTQIRDRLEKLTLTSLPNSEAGQYVTALMSEMKNAKQAYHPHNSDLANKMDYSEIFRRAGEGQLFAKQMGRAVRSCVSAIELLERDIQAGVAASDAEIVHQYADFLRSRCEFACSLPLHLAAPLSAAIKRVLSCTKSAKEELDARICDIGINLGKLDPSYVSASISKFPDEPLLSFYRVSVFAFLEDWRQAKKHAQEGLNRFPDDADLLYDQAVACRMTANSPDTWKDEIQQHRKFLAKVPKDHRKVPEVYYSIAQAHASIAMYWKMSNRVRSAEALALAKESVQSGLRAEKDLMPCFLPYDTAIKKTTESLIGVLELAPCTKQSKSQQARQKPSSTKPKPQAGPDIALKNNRLPEVVLSSPIRLLMVTSHRKTVSEMQKAMSSRANSVTIKIDTTLQPPKTQTGSEAKLAKPITLQEMDASKDRVYNGRKITLTCIEDGYRMTGIMYVVEDKNGDTQRMCVYNTPDDPRLAYGSKVTIINPYMRMAMDGKATVRVDDPASIVYHKDEFFHDRCRYCGGQGAAFSCGKCRRAKYCGQDCQIKDWKIMKHSYICQ